MTAEEILIKNLLTIPNCDMEDINRVKEEDCQVHNAILLSIEEYGKQQYNQAIRDIQAEYEINKEFNVTSILKYLK